MDYQLTALFHDLLEDTDATEEEIFDLGGARVLEAVRLLTKQEGYVMAEYVAGIRTNPIAFVVKAADRLHNLRTAFCTDEALSLIHISAKTVAGEGSTFTISLPLTLAIIQALMVKVGEEKYAIPLGSINGIEDIAKEDISLVQSKEVINLRGRVIPILRLHDILDMEPVENDPESLIVVIMQKAEQQVGLVIDELIGQQETVIKSLGHHITCDKLFSGATILGDGEVALILDTNTLM